MSKQDIRTIEGLYPPDSEHDLCAKAGIKFMTTAILQNMDWRNLPDDVLSEMARLCIKLEQGI